MKRACSTPGLKTSVTIYSDTITAISKYTISMLVWSPSHVFSIHMDEPVLCVLAWPDACHRLTVADEAERRFPGLRVTHLPAVGRGKPDVPASVLYTVDENVPGYPVLWLSRSRQEVKVYSGVAGHFRDPGEARTEFESFYGDTFVACMLNLVFSIGM